jgi:C-terminal peptidase (prc)
MSTSAICFGATEILKMDDVNRIMNQIFEQHVDKKEITSAILKKSFKVYIDQFDPDRVYLLDGEVQKYLSMGDAEVLRMVEKYKQGKFPEFEELNGVIQQSILRSRKIRQSLEGDIAALFQKSDGVASDGNQDWTDPDLKRPFAKSVPELTDRIKQQIVKFISKERKRYGDSYVIAREPQTIRIFEKEDIIHEDQYLFVNENGQPMSAVENQNAFVMHILKALASALDAHTTVLNSTEAYDMRLRLEKEMQGLGILLRPTTDGYIISQLVREGPAAKSGLVQINDKLWEIDGTQVSSLPLDKVMEMFRGKNGTNVTLLLKRTTNERGSPVEKMVKATLTRENIAVNEDRVQSNIVSTAMGNIGIIKLDTFYQGDNGITSENDVRSAIQKLDQHGNLRGLILDLRENSGGFLSQAVKVAGLFITNGVIVVSKYFNGEEHFYRDMDGKVSYEGPLVVLTSKATASAAEIVAQALQDYGVALVVGDEHTYGKGTIQSQTVTEDQASTFFKVTVGTYYTVSGKTPQIQGVKADIVVPSEFAHDIIGEEFLDNPLKQGAIQPSFNDKLADIAPNLKPWYMRYYAPTLQHKKDFWSGMLPDLRKNSSYRISNNKDYEAFIKGEKITQGRNVNRSLEDMQLSEAVSITKDMIALQAQLRGNEPDLKGSTAQTAGIIHERN